MSIVLEEAEAKTPIVVTIGNARYCLIKAAAAATGLSVKAIEKKIERGVWVRGVHYRKAPDGHIWINMPAVYTWIESDAEVTDGA